MVVEENSYKKELNIFTNMFYYKQQQQQQQQIAKLLLIALSLSSFTTKTIIVLAITITPNNNAPILLSTSEKQQQQQTTNIYENFDNTLKQQLQLQNEEQEQPDLTTRLEKEEVGRGLLLPPNSTQLNTTQLN